MSFIPGQIVVCVRDDWDFSRIHKDLKIEGPHPRVFESFTVERVTETGLYFEGIDQTAVLLGFLGVRKVVYDYSYEPAWFQRRPPNYVLTDEQVNKMLGL